MLSLGARARSRPVEFGVKERNTAPTSVFFKRNPENKQTISSTHGFPPGKSCTPKAGVAKKASPKKAAAAQKSPKNFFSLTSDSAVSSMTATHCSKVTVPTLGRCVCVCVCVCVRALDGGWYVGAYACARVCRAITKRHYNGGTASCPPLPLERGLPVATQREQPLVILLG